MVKEAFTQFVHHDEVKDPVIADELQFIRWHSNPGDECLLLMNRSGAYYLAAGLSSPVQGPGLIDIALKSDQDNFRKQLMEKQYPCVFLASKNNYPKTIGFDPMTMIPGRYQVRAENSQKTLLYLTPIAKP